MAANQDLFDEGVKHQIDVQRFTTMQLARLLRELSRADGRLLEWLTRRIPVNASRNRRENTKRLRRLFSDFRERRNATMKALRDNFRSDLSTFGEEESDFEEALLLAILGGSIARPTKATLNEIITGIPFNSSTDTSATFAQWFEALRGSDRRRVEQAIFKGVSEGQTRDSIVRMIGGARGVLSTTRRGLETLVRSAIAHVSNLSREAVWQVNGQKVVLVWQSILDDQTCPICRARDGRNAPIGGSGIAPQPRLIPPGARPPAHPRCRCVMIGKLLGQPGAATDVTYQQWLGAQPVSVQDDILGPTRGKLFRDGEITLDRFVDRQGQELTLEDLAKRRPTAFRDAGLDPDDFT